MRLTADGDLTDWTSPRGAIKIDKPGDFRMGWGRIGKGRYRLGFEVVNLAGLAETELDDFTLE